MTDKIYLGILIILLIVVLIGDVKLSESMGKLRKNVKKIIKIK